MQLSVDGNPVAVERKPRDVLLALLRAEGELVTKAELFDQVWAGRVVTDGVLSQAILGVREALGDKDRRIVKTVHGLGYRIDAPIVVEGRDSAETRLQLEAGTEPPGLPDWTLERQLTTRPHNELWCIRHRESGERRCLKLALSERAARALQREVTLTRVLGSQEASQKRVVQALEWQTDQQPAWLVTAWYPAGSLSDWLEQQGGAAAVPMRRRVQLVATLARSMSAAHALGVMHKDLKPGNILMDGPGQEAEPLLADFGSGIVRSRARLNQAGITVMGFTQTLKAEDSTSGTPAYMAPEVIAGGVFSEQSDIYSLGVLLYQLVIGDLRQPLAAGWDEEVSDPALRKIIATACAGRPDRRLTSMSVLAEQLEAWRPVPRWQRTARWPWISAAAIFVLLGLATKVFWPDSVPIHIDRQAQAAVSQKHGLVLLPFDLHGVDPELAPAMKGLQDALATPLSQLPGYRLILANHLAALGVSADNLPAVSQALNAEQLVRGSVQQSGNALQVHLQLLDASGQTRWARSVRGQREHLFDLQNQIGQALADALGVPAQSSTVDVTIPNEAAYERYLAAVAKLEAVRIHYGRKQFDALSQATEAALSADPHFYGNHLLALRKAAGGFWFGFLSHEQARQEATFHLAELRRLGADRYAYQQARAVIAYHLDLDPRKGLELLAPYESRFVHDTVVLSEYLYMLRRAGEVEKALEILHLLKLREPGSPSAAQAALETWSMLGRPESALQDLMSALRRDPTQQMMMARALEHAARFGSDLALARLLEFVNSQPVPADVLTYALGLGAIRTHDFDQVLQSSAAMLGRQIGSGGAARIVPGELVHALVLSLAGRPDEEVQAMARAASAKIAEARQRWDSVPRKHTHAIAVLVSGERERAWQLSDEAMQEMAASSNRWDEGAMLWERTVMAAWSGDEERLIANVRQRLAHRYPLDVCNLGKSILDYPSSRFPRVLAILEEPCADSRRATSVQLKKFEAWLSGQTAG